MATVKLTVSQRFDLQIAMHTSTQTADVNLAQDIQNHLSNPLRKHGILNYVKHRKGQLNKIGQTDSIMCKRMKMLSTNMLKFIVLKTSFLYYHFLFHATNHMVHAY